MTASSRDPLPASSLILAALFLIPVGAFLLGFLGHIGSLHHATHLLLTAIGLELLLLASWFVVTAMERTARRSPERRGR